MNPSNDHALVYGGSMVGLVMAGVLSRHFTRVTLIERDRFEDGPQPRKGVPQSLHIHGLLTRGMNVFSGVFPGLSEHLTAAGGQVFDMIEPHAAFSAGVWRPRFRSGLTAHGMSRPLFEWVVREQLKIFTNVSILDGREVAGLRMSPDRTRVTGVQVQLPGGEQPETLEAALVVDCSGRGSRAPQWLEGHGYPRVEETRIQVNVAYASRAYRKPEGFAPGWRNLSISPRLPQERRLGILQEIEEGRWLALLGGWLNEAPSADDANFLDFARALPQPHLYEAIRNAEPLGPVHRFQFPHSQWRHYEKLPRAPEGFAIAGDAFCSFNPIYGQGMTTGAMQAELLGECLKQGVTGVARRYHQRAGRMLAGAWSMAVSGDLRFPEVAGQRSPLSGVVNWYSDRFQRLTGHDEEALLTLTRVLHMLEAPTALFAPRMVLKALTSRPPHTPRPGPAPLAAKAERAHLPRQAENG